MQMAAAAAVTAALSSSWLWWHLGGGLSISHSVSESLIWNVDELWGKLLVVHLHTKVNLSLKKKTKQKNNNSNPRWFNLADGGENICSDWHWSCTIQWAVRTPRQRTTTCAVSRHTLNRCMLGDSRCCALGADDRRAEYWESILLLHRHTQASTVIWFF